MSNQIDEQDGPVTEACTITSTCPHGVQLDGFSICIDCINQPITPLPFRVSPASGTFPAVGTFPPAVCTGSGWPARIPYGLQGGTCGICGQSVGVTPEGRCETHPYFPVKKEP